MLQGRQSFDGLSRLLLRDALLRGRGLQRHEEQRREHGDGAEEFAQHMIRPENRPGIEFRARL